jgi:hypothetical protein
MAFADQQHERLDPQGLATHASHRLGVKGHPDVNFSRQHPPGNLGAEHLARDDGHVRVVVLDGGQDCPKGLEAGHGGVAETNRPRNARAGEAGPLGGALEGGERQRRLLEQCPARGGELDVPAIAREQFSPERLLELVNLVAQ